MLQKTSYFKIIFRLQVWQYMLSIMFTVYATTEPGL